MIEADERSGFRQAIALHDSEAESLQEEFGVRTQRSATGDESPEAKTEETVNAAEAPGAAEKWLSLRYSVILIEPPPPPARIDFALDDGTEKIEHTRDGDEHGGAFASDGTQNLRGIGGIFEGDGSAKKRRDEKRHELSENVAERNQRDEANGMQETFIFQIGFHAALDRLEVGEKISVREDDATRLGGGSGGEKNFDQVLAGKGFAG